MIIMMIVEVLYENITIFLIIGFFLAVAKVFLLKILQF